MFGGAFFFQGQIGRFAFFLNDIGWDPFVVLVGAIAVNLGDIVLARLVPSLSTDGFNTGIGALTNLLLSLVLLLWPGTADTSSIQP